MLKVEGLQKRIGSFLLQADFEVPPGERAAVVGPSGCGKTSLLRMIAGLEAPAAGVIRIGDEDVTALPPEKRRIGVVFQEQALFPTLSVLENAAFALRMQGASREKREAEALPWLAKVGLADRRDDSVTRLSGGERQRIAFIRAIVWKPRLLLLDEPFSALDAGMRAAIRLELVELHKLWPVPLLLVTHDEADLAAVATRKLSFTQQSGEGSAVLPIP